MTPLSNEADPIGRRSPGLTSRDVIRGGRGAGYGIINYGPRFAGCLLAALPLLLILMLGMRYFIRGLTAGAIKA